MCPFGLSGGLQDTMTELSPLVTALMSDGDDGAEIKTRTFWNGNNKSHKIKERGAFEFIHLQTLFPFLESPISRFSFAPCFKDFSLSPSFLCWTLQDWDWWPEWFQLKNKRATHIKSMSTLHSPGGHSFPSLCHPQVKEKENQLHWPIGNTKGPYFCLAIPFHFKKPPPFSPFRVVETWREIWKLSGRSRTGPKRRVRWLKIRLSSPPSPSVFSGLLERATPEYVDLVQTISQAILRGFS